MNNMQEKPILSKKTIKTIIIATICGFVLIIALFIVDRVRNATVEILVAPTFAKVEIDGKTYPSKKTIKTTPKDEEFTAIVSADGFETKEITFKVEKNQTSYIYVSLNNKESGEQWYLDQSGEEYDRFVMVEEALLEIASDDFAKQYPIVTILPYINSEDGYRIDYGDYEGCEGGFCLQITDNTGENHEKALQYIRDNGFVPDDYQIVYKNILQSEDNNPIINYLPYEEGFTLDYNYAMNGSLIISISSPQASLDQAVGILTDLARLAEHGTVAEYNIQFTYQDFSYPFQNPGNSNDSNPKSFLSSIYNDVKTLQVGNGAVIDDYYYTTLIIGTTENRDLATFKVILKRNGPSWELLSQPYPILTTSNTPKNIPLDILNTANNL